MSMSDYDIEYMFGYLSSIVLPCSPHQSDTSVRKFYPDY